MKLPIAKIFQKNIRNLIRLSIFIAVSASFNLSFLDASSLPKSKGKFHKHQNTDNSGKEIFKAHCLSCHQADGSGVPGMYPPLQKSDWVNGDKNKLINLLLNGLEGEIIVNSDTYSQVMPKQNNLSDQEIAAVLNYIRNNLENHADSIKPEEVSILRIKIK
jgi:mono/diheme cytochrome c family protein